MPIRPLLDEVLQLVDARTAVGSLRIEMGTPRDAPFYQLSTAAGRCVRLVAGDADLTLYVLTRPGGPVAGEARFTGLPASMIAAAVLDALS